MLKLLHIGLLGVQGFIAVVVSYLLLLSRAAFKAPQKTASRIQTPTNKFIILIPAHNEELLLPTLLDNLANLDYPRSMYAVHIVADNCTDKTTAVSRQSDLALNINVHERTNDKLQGKGYALQWLIERLHADKVNCDAVVFLDADSLVSPNFLQVMDSRLQRGERVIQAYYAVRDPGRTWNISLRYAALTLVHYLRPQGRMVWRTSAGLKGNGMVFAYPLIQQQTWSNDLTEDIELHMQLILGGERVTFAPDAIVWAEMPTSLSRNRSQHTRWERGRLQMAGRFVPILMQAAMREKRKGNKPQAFLFFDAAAELIIPPFSVLLTLSGLTFLAGITLNIVGYLISFRSKQKEKQRLGHFGGVSISWLNPILSLGIILGQVMYVFSGLHLAKAPRSAYLALIYSPIYLLWKCSHYLAVLKLKDNPSWQRTQRNRV